MLLTVDIGNTNIDLGLFQGDRLLLHCKVPTDRDASEGQYQDRLRTALGPTLAQEPLEGVAIGSVVRLLGERLEGACRSLGASPVLQVQADWDLGLSIDWAHPHRVGIDRLVAAAYAFQQAPRGHAVVVADAGTAITVDAVDAQGTFLGGAIVPGLRLMLQALHTGTSLLPQVELSEAAPLLGKDTASCMLSGVVHGGAALLEGLCRRFAAHLDAPVHAVLTGGDAPLLQAHAPCFAHADPALVLRGLALAWRRRVGKGY